MIQDAARNWVACGRGGGLSDPLDLRPWCPKSVSSASPTSKVVGSYVSTLLGSARASYEVSHLNIFSQAVRNHSSLRTAKPSQRAGTGSASLWEHVTSCCNAASSPGASRKRVPPSLDVPSGNTLGSITHEATSALRRQIPRQPDSWRKRTFFR